MKKIDNLNRRNFIKMGIATSGLLLCSPEVLFSADGTALKKVVVVGGGVAGATVARYLRKFIPQSSLLEITIIEPKTTYSTPFGSNEILTATRTLEELTFDYKALESELGTKIVHQKAITLDNTNKKVTVADGRQYSYDYCIVATGIGFEYSDIVGIDESNRHEAPHAYDLLNDGSTEQITLLKNQLNAMADGSKVVVVAPQNAYRCPPAPYERASQIAQYIKEHKPNCRLTILDPKTSFAKQDAFEQAWRELYGYETESALLTWESSVVISEIVMPTTGAKIIKTQTDEIEADVLSYIPTMKASKFAYDAGLIDTTSTSFDIEKRWAPVNQETFESTMAGKEGIYIIGDSCQSSLPKSGYAANSEAKACAMAIVSKIKGITPLPNTIMTNGCYSFIGQDYAISIFQKFKLNEDKSTYVLVPQTRGTSPLEADALWRKKEAEQGHAWYANFRRDCFGV